LINVAVEELLRQRFELPAFRTLDELARHVRAIVDRRLFDSVLVQLSEEQRRQLDHDSSDSATIRCPSAHRSRFDAKLLMPFPLDEQPETVVVA
jgi:hypothetical protein